MNKDFIVSTFYIEKIFSLLLDDIQIGREVP